MLASFGQFSRPSTSPQRGRLTFSKWRALMPTLPPVSNISPLCSRNLPTSWPPPSDHLLVSERLATGLLAHRHLPPCSLHSQYNSFSESTISAPRAFTVLLFFF